MQATEVRATGAAAIGQFGLIGSQESPVGGAGLPGGQDPKSGRPLPHLRGLPLRSAVPAEPKGTARTEGLRGLKVASEQAFQSISVTAEKWLPLRGVPKAQLKDHLLELRRGGYTLLGVEQTHTSVPLDQCLYCASRAVMDML